MAFEKIVFAMKTWKDKVSGNTPVTAAELNRIEKGISDCAKQTNALGDSVSLGDGKVTFKSAFVANKDSGVSLVGRSNQTYFIFGPGGIVATVTHCVGKEPSVSQASGQSVTATNGSQDGTVVIKVGVQSVRLLIGSVFDFSVQ